MAHIGAYGHRMSHSGGGPCLVDVGSPIPQQSSGPRNEGRAEGGSPSGGVATKGISGDYAFSGRGHPHDGVAVIGERGPRVRVARGGNAHHVILIGGGINDLLHSIIPCGGGTDHAVLVGVIHGLGKLQRVRGHIEAHVDDVSAVLHTVIDSVQNVGQVSGPVRTEGLERQQLRLRSDQVDDAHYHRAVAESGVLTRRLLIAIKHGSGGLVKHGRRGLIYLSDVGVARRRRSGEVGHHRTTRLVARKVVSRATSALVDQQNGLQDWMIGIHTSINIGDDSRSRNVKSRLRLG